LRAIGWRRGSSARTEELAEAFPRVSIVVVTFDAPELLRACLDSIERTTAWPRLEIVVVDNGGNPRTAEVARQDRKLDLRYLPFEGNLGFAGGTNRGVRESDGQFLMLLNDDTVLSPGCVARLVAHLEADPALGIVCPVTNEIGNDAKVTVDYRTFEEMIDQAGHRAWTFRGRRRPTTLVPLFCAVMRREVFVECGGLDERYEVGMFEDDDLSRTLIERGYGLGIAEDAYVHHVGQASFGRLSDDEYLAVWEANKRRFEEKWSVRWRPPGGGPR
jgi:GT2 family glycosyltransferase